MHGNYDGAKPGVPHPLIGRVPFVLDGLESLLAPPLLHTLLFPPKLLVRLFERLGMLGLGVLQHGERLHLLDLPHLPHVFLDLLWRHPRRVNRGRLFRRHRFLCRLDRRLPPSKLPQFFSKHFALLAQRPCMLLLQLVDLRRHKRLHLVQLRYALRGQRRLHVFHLLPVRRLQLLNHDRPNAPPKVWSAARAAHTRTRTARAAGVAGIAAEYV